MVNNSTKCNHFLPQIIAHKKAMTYKMYDVGNPGPGFGQMHKCGDVKAFMYM